MALLNKNLLYQNMSADEALDYVQEHDKVLLAYATIDDMLRLENFLQKRIGLLGIDVVCVEPTEANAEVMQLIKHPTYALYYDGNEKSLVVGNATMLEWFDRTF